MLARVDGNFAALKRWVSASPWVDFLARDKAYRSYTSVCLKITEAGFSSLNESEQRAVIKRFAALLEAEGAAFDIAGHANAPPGLRIWCGATVERADIEALLPWLDWAWAQVKA